MPHSYDRRYRDRDRRRTHIPIHVAEQWAEEHQRLLDEVRELRRLNESLRSDDVVKNAKIEALERRLRDEEESSAELRRQLNRLAEAFEKARKELSTEDQLHRARLSRRIEELTGDLERVQRRTNEAVRQAKREERIRLLEGLGPLLDSIDRGLEQEAEGPWREGLEAIRAQFLKILAAEDVRLVGTPGEMMNPNFHQAIAAIDTEEWEPGQIIRVERAGFVLDDDTVIRPALVTVAR